MTDVQGATDALETLDCDALEYETGCAEQLRSGANFIWGDSNGDLFNLLSLYAAVVHRKKEFISCAIRIDRKNFCHGACKTFKNVY